MTQSKKPQTLYDKIWQNHLVHESDDGVCLLYIDRHLIHEVTSPQAFEALRLADRQPRRAKAALAAADHNVPTIFRKEGDFFIEDEESRAQVEALRHNCQQYDICYFDMDNPRRGIVHVIGPEQGFTQPGMTIVCGDSHTSTHGAFGALAFGIGTSEVEHVLATQTLRTARSRNMRITVTGARSHGVTAKDVILAIIGKIKTDGGTGCVIEYAGDSIRALSMEERMTVCNMSIEAGARAGLIAPDATTEQWIKGRPLAPADEQWEAATAYWRQLYSDEDAVFDKEVALDATHIAPQVTWGTTPHDVESVTAYVPDPHQEEHPQRRAAMERALEYMGLRAGMALTDIAIDHVFIGSCTNARLGDLRAAAEIVEKNLSKGKKIDTDKVKAMVVPGSGLIKEQAEKEDLDRIFTEAGFEWREAGCSMCLAMNSDRLRPGERCASTSNRNFEGRQGLGGRTHLMSPIMAAAAAFEGHITDVRNFL